MSQTTPTAADKAAKSIATGDEQMGKNKFDAAKKAYEEALTALMAEVGHLHPSLAPVLEKTVEAIYQLGAESGDTNRKLIGRYLKMLLTIKQREVGPRGAELIPVLEKLVVFYDFDGAHMLAIEVLQRIDDINANLEVGQTKGA